MIFMEKLQSESTSWNFAEYVYIFALLTAGLSFLTALALRAFALCSNRERNGLNGRSI